MADPRLDELLDLACRLADDAGGLIRRARGRAGLAVATKSSATDLVTEVDRAAEQAIVAGIRAARPDDGITGEEGSSAAGTSGVRWIIDPVDGTTNFVFGHPNVAVSIAVEVDGVTAVGVVDAPLLSERFTAVLGEGAYLDGTRCHCTDTADLGTALVATGFGYVPDRRARQAAVLTHVLPRVRDIRRGGSAAIDLCWVACGRVDAYYEEGLNEWDLAAGALIAREAGAAVGGLDPGRPDESGFALAAGPRLFGPLRDLLVAAGAHTP